MVGITGEKIYVEKYYICVINIYPINVHREVIKSLPKNIIK